MKKLILLSILLIVGCAPKTTTTFYIGMTEEEFMKMYGSQTWDNMSRADQQAARKLYGFSTSHGDSMTGGAFHMVAERER